MTLKLIEIRDRATCIPALAIRLDSAQEPEESWLLWRAGFGDREEQSRYILLAQISGRAGRITYDPLAWGDRTYFCVHRWLLAHFDEVTSGDVVDVEFILGERSRPKQSERLRED